MDKFDLDTWLGNTSDTPMTPIQLLANLVAQCHSHYEIQHKSFICELYGIYDNPLEMKLKLDEALKNEKVPNNKLFN